EDQVVDLPVAVDVEEGLGDVEGHDLVGGREEEDRKERARTGPLEDAGEVARVEARDGAHRRSRSRQVEKPQEEIPLVAVGVQVETRDRVDARDALGRLEEREVSPL